jgi:hypothetical protein
MYVRAAAILFLFLAVASVNAFIFASNAIVAVPIAVTNNQGVATSSPWQQLMIVNSLAYKQYEAGSLMNNVTGYPPHIGACSFGSSYFRGTQSY